MRHTLMRPLATALSKVERLMRASLQTSNRVRNK
jgi:hypothetical protein